MSRDRVSWTWRHAVGQSELPFTTKGVLWAISHFMNDLGNGAYPTTKQLATYCSLSERAVCTHIQNAIDAGWLRSKVHGFKGQKWKNHEYEAHWPAESGEAKGTERGSAAFEKGTEPDDKKALNDVQSKVSVQHLKSTVSPDADTAFEALWSEFPKTGYPSKQKSLKAWKRLKASERPQCEIGAQAYIKWFRAERERRPDTPAPHLSTFINDRRWADYQPQQVAEPDSEPDWGHRLELYDRHKVWPSDWGPEPGYRGCKVPAELLERAA